MVQWEEEVGILECEIEHIFHFFARYCGVWREMAMQSQKLGFSAYAHKTADVYARCAIHCKSTFERVATCRRTPSQDPSINFHSHYDLTL